MKRIGWLVLLLVVMTSVSALADSVNFTAASTTLIIYPYIGYNNVYLLMSGPGLFLGGWAGTPPNWFSGTVGYLPGSIGGGKIPLTLYDVGGYLPGLGGIDVAGGQMNCCSATLFAGTFTFPTTGKDFTIYLPATISGISGTASNGDAFSFSPTAGSVKLSFTYSGGLYYGSQGSFGPAPEPGTLALMGTGIIAILSLVRRRSRV